MAKKNNNAFSLKHVIISVGILCVGLGVGYGVGLAASQLDIQGPQYKLLANSANVSEEVKDFTQDLENLSNDSSIDFDLYKEVWGIVKNKYVENSEISDKDLFYGSVRGLVRSLDDPYSDFFTPEDAKQFTENLAGSFQGIGAEIGIKDSRLTIIAPLPNSPAEKAGLMAGDKVYYIDDFSTNDISIEDAVQKIRGEKGTDVTLTVTREGINDVLEIVITRDDIELESVTYEKIEELEGNYYAIKFVHFTQDAKDEFDEILDTILKEDVDGIILDIRNNPGGFLNISVDIASLWVDEGVIVSEDYGDNGTGKVHWAKGASLLKDIPTVVLVNKGSASASEILAGALQDHNQALIVGETTFGKGSVQSFLQLDDGSGLKVTVAKWLTPKGAVIDKVGIDPDINVELTLEDFENEKDPQLEKARELIQMNQSEWEKEIVESQSQAEDDSE